MYQISTPQTDSTHVLAAIRTLNRLELVGETLRATLNALAVVAPDWLQTIVSPDWFDRYSHRIEEYDLPQGIEARKQYAQTIGCDGMVLLDRISEVMSFLNFRWTGNKSK